MMTDIPKLEDFEDPDFSPDSNDELLFGTCQDPYPRFRELLAKGGPVQRGEFRDLLGLSPDMTLGDQPVFIVFGPEENRELLNKPEIFTNDHFAETLGMTFGKTISAMNPPEHTRYRRIFQKAFLPHVVKGWADEFIDPVIHELIDAFGDAGKVDLMPEFAERYPFEIIYRQLRLPEGEQQIFHRLAITQTQFMVDFERAQEAGRKLGTYFSAVVKDRRENPDTDLISVLATVEVDGERLPDDVVISFLRQLINAAGDTTYRTTGNLLVALLKERPDQFEMLKKDRSLLPNAIEEVLRWEGPVTHGFRNAVQDYTLAGVKIPAGSVIQTIWVAGNRLPDQFPNPDTYDLTRTNSSRHMSFAAGAHICVGQHLARLEMSRALTILMDRLPNLRLDPDMPPPQIRGCSMRVPKHIHARFD